MVILKTNRETYDENWAAAYSMTVKEFIELLEQEDENEKIIFSNDNGYTYGVIRENTIGNI